MNGQVRDIEGNIKKTIKLGDVFETIYRPDLISRVVAASQSIQKQPQGRDPMAGSVLPRSVSVWVERKHVFHA